MSDGAAMRRGVDRIAVGPPGSLGRDNDSMSDLTVAEHTNGCGHAARAI